MQEPKPTLLPVCANEVADELLLDSVEARCHCPSCGAPVNKAIFADGDAENCGVCSEPMWFELRGDEVHAHQARQQPQGQSLSQVLGQKLGFR